MRFIAFLVLRIDRFLSIRTPTKWKTIKEFLVARLGERLISKIISYPVSTQKQDEIHKLHRKFEKLDTDEVVSFMLTFNPAKVNANDVKALGEKMPMHEFGSVVPGNEGWKARWDQTAREKRILFCAPKDFSGSAYKLVEAINTYTDFSARLIVSNPHPFGYPNDLIFLTGSEERMELLVEQSKQALYLVLKDEQSWFEELLSGADPNLSSSPSVRLFFTKEENQIKLFTLYGGYARRLRDSKDWRQFLRLFDSLLLFTPDLALPGYKNFLVPHTIDTEALSFSWSDSRRIVHSVSTLNPIRKGSGFLYGALAEIEAEFPAGWQGWSFELITGVSYEQALARKMKGSLYFDQAGREVGSSLGTSEIIGWYGNAAVEALAFGIPTMVHLSKNAKESAESLGMPAEFPMIEIQRSSEDVAKRIKEYVFMSSSDRKELALQSREFAESWHGYASVSRRLVNFLGNL